MITLAKASFWFGHKKVDKKNNLKKITLLGVAFPIIAPAFWAYWRKHVSFIWPKENTNAKEFLIFSIICGSLKWKYSIYLKIQYNFRTRTCDNPLPDFGGLDCVGDSNETANCSQIMCPISILRNLLTSSYLRFVYKSIFILEDHSRNTFRTQKCLFLTECNIMLP